MKDYRVLVTKTILPLEILLIKNNPINVIVVIMSQIISSITLLEHNYMLLVIRVCRAKQS